MTAPALCPPELRPAVESMLQELEDFGLTVALIPAPEQRHCVHCVRTVFQANPGWYRDLAATYQRSRRRLRKDKYVDPVFARGDVLRTLRLLLTTGTRSWLAGPLLAAAERLRQREREDFARLQAEMAQDMAACFPWDLPADAAERMVRI